MTIWSFCGSTQFFVFICDVFKKFGVIKKIWIAYENKSEKTRKKSSYTQKNFKYILWKELAVFRF